MTPERVPKVFISYSYDSQSHADVVLKLSNRFRADGIDCSLDQYEESPPEGWPLWMERQIRESDFVLLVCTEIYLKKLHGKVEADKGLGVRWEGTLVYQHIYAAGTSNTKFVPILLANGKTEHIPIPLQGATYYRPEIQDQYDRLCRRMRGIPNTEKPPLGTPKPLPPKRRKTNPGMFLTGFIDPSLWNKARWQGVFYYCEPTQPPWLGLVFSDEDAARQIFDQWHERIGRNDKYEEMRVSIIEGEIPGEEQGYTVLLSANVMNIYKRADDLGIAIPKDYVLVINRLHRMNPRPGSKNIEMFKTAFERFQCYQLCPVIATPTGVKLLPDYGLIKKEINFRQASEITSKNDPDSIALKSFWDEPKSKKKR